MTLRFLVSVLPDFFLKVSPTLSTNSKGNALHALKSRLSDPTNVLQSWEPILALKAWNKLSLPPAILSRFDLVYVMIGDLDDQTDYHISLKPKVCLLFLEIGARLPDGILEREPICLSAHIAQLMMLLLCTLDIMKVQCKMEEAFRSSCSLTLWFLWLSPKVSATLSTDSEVLTLKYYADVSDNDHGGTIPIDPWNNSEEEAFQSPSSTTLRFLVSVLPGFFLKVSPTLSTNSEGNALHALRSRPFNPTNVLQSWDLILVNPCTCRLINNKLTGSIPKEFITVSNLKVFDASNNDLCETIPIDPRNNK
ncbi:hypothetical protein HHK36_027239 [Tetracentron sinense]|uniref:Leucine-rich repeat-containing N-terminal plant-type domain-containing protein n=1 Tax=Tetracentron sinense TaxID=13715 RepID=A0A835D675_TETSI|nr:hypothetical protein HHK36_027239 [Tetracentron sinense]